MSDGVTAGRGGVGNKGPAWAAGFSGAEVGTEEESILAAALGGVAAEVAATALAGTRAAASPRSGVIRFE